MRLIDADELINVIDSELFSTESRKCYEKMRLRKQPTIDAEPVRHGRWIDEIEPNAVTASGREVHVFRCSACDFTWANKTAVLHYFKYCPNCGAKMDGENECSDG